MVSQIGQDVNLEGILTETRGRWSFMCVDDGEEEKILVFATDEMLDKMQEAEMLSRDGTFYVMLGYDKCSCAN